MGPPAWIRTLKSNSQTGMSSGTLLSNSLETVFGLWTQTLALMPVPWEICPSSFLCDNRSSIFKQN